MKGRVRLPKIRLGLAIATEPDFVGRGLFDFLGLFSWGSLMG